MLKSLPVVLFALMLCRPAAAGFDWGADCSSGDNAFQRWLNQDAVIEIGEIPVGKGDVEILLSSDQDLDIQLIDVLTGDEIIAWPSGLLNGATEACTQYQGQRYCYSGYNGGQTNETLGHEWIRVDGTTKRRLLMRAYAYAAGQAQVEYRWTATEICNEVGDGAFTQWVPEDISSLVGEIPAGKVHVEVELEASLGRDLDIQLYDPREEQALVAWPSGQLNAASQQSMTLAGMTITYSGYNGIAGNWGHEKITIEGRLDRALELRAFGYQSGFATVRYRWGQGAGALCGGIAGFSCVSGYVCKGLEDGVADAAGTCHGENWCGSTDSAAQDCAALPHIAVPGRWSCDDHYLCHWDTHFCGRPNPYNVYISTDPDRCASMRFSCQGFQWPFRDPCGCGCACPESIDCSDGQCDASQVQVSCPNTFIVAQ